MIIYAHTLFIRIIIYSYYNLFAASALPMPGFRPGSSLSTDNRAVIGKLFGATSCEAIDNESKLELPNGVDDASDHGSTKRRQSLHRERGLNGRISRISMNSKGSTEVAVDFELPNHRGILEINGRDVIDSSQIHIGNGTAIGTTIRLNDISTDSNNYVRSMDIRPTLSRGTKSINSSENDGYESSHCTPSERSLSYHDQHSKLKQHRLLDIEAQISDFAYCSPKKRPYVYREGHIPPGYYEHNRTKSNNKSCFNDSTYTALKINGTYMTKRRQSSIDIEKHTRYDSGSVKGKLHSRYK